MPIETEGLDHNCECPKCKGALTEGVNYEVCPHCEHRLGDKTSASWSDNKGTFMEQAASPRRTRQWQCPQCANWDYEAAGPRGGAAWHDCQNCGYKEQSPTNMSRRYSPQDWDADEQGEYDYDEWTDEKGNPHPSTMEEPNPEMYPQDAPHDQLDDPWNQPRHAKFQVVTMGEMQQPGGVGATQTTGLTDGEGIQHPDDHSQMADAGQNSFEQNVALETWVNFAVDMLNRGRSEQEVKAQLAHDGCPEPDSVLQRAIEQPQQDPVGSDGAADPFETPAPADPTGTMESVHQQPPVLSHWLESPEDKPEANQQVRIAGTSWRGIVLDRWEDLYGQEMAKVALSDGGIVTVAAEVVEPDGERKIQDPATEIQSFIDGLPEVEPTRPSVIARIANLKMVRMAVRDNISKCGFSDQVKLERLERRAGDEILELTDFLGRLASDSDQQYVREQQRYRAAGQRNRATVTNEAFNSRLAESAAIFVQELAPEHRADIEQTLYAAARFASANNGDVNGFIAAVKKAWGNPGDGRDSDEFGPYDELPAKGPNPRDPNPRDPGEVDIGWPVRGTGDAVDPKRDDFAMEDDPNAPGRGAFDHLDPGADDPQLRERGGCPECGSQNIRGNGECEDCGFGPWSEYGAGGGGMSDEDYWRNREQGSGTEYPPEEDPFTIWPNGHPMDH